MCFTINHMYRLLYYCVVSIDVLYYSTGVILRDSHGVAQVRYITGNKILRVLKAKGNFLNKLDLLSCTGVAKKTATI